MPRVGQISPLIRSWLASRARLLRRTTYPRQFGGVSRPLYRLGGPQPYGHEPTDGDRDGDTTAGPVVGADAVLHPGGLATGRAQVHRVAGPVHGGCALFYAPEKERAAPGVAPRNNTVRRPGAVRGRQALPGDASGAAGHRDGLGRGPAVTDTPPDWESAGGAVEQRRGTGQDRIPRVPVAPGDGPAALRREPRGRVAPGQRHMEGGKAYHRA